MPTLPPNTPCPCGSDHIYGKCCDKYHSGNATAETAEKLMRSRYSAFVVRDGAYLSATLAEEKRSGFNSQSIQQDQTCWSGLEIVSHIGGGLLDQTGKVEFIARFVENGEIYQLHEQSNFERRGGKWYYVDGIFPTENEKIDENASIQNGMNIDKLAKIGRNDPCPCGSGKKFKKCCS
ncbi:MAG: YchJ family protein [Rhodospirillales bacterium]|nr:YchJ family protein [Rhodospirillales bacterium]